jgi:hypothetical protein
LNGAGARRVTRSLGVVGSSVVRRCGLSRARLRLYVVSVGGVRGRVVRAGCWRARCRCARHERLLLGPLEFLDVLNINYLS